MKRDDRSPEAYLASVEGEQGEIVREIRELILREFPEAEEHMEYGMLAYGDLANLAAQKNYVSLYVTPSVMARYQRKHPSANCGKCCLRMRSRKHYDPEAIRELIREVEKLPPAERGC